MNISIIGKNINSEDSNVQCIFNENQTHILGSNNIDIELSTKDFLSILLSYEPKSNIDGIPPEQRDFFRFLKKIPYDNSTLSNIYRSFPVVAVSIHFNNIVSLLIFFWTEPTFY